MHAQSYESNKKSKSGSDDWRNVAGDTGAMGSKVTTIVLV